MNRRLLLIVAISSVFGSCVTPGAESADGKNQLRAKPQPVALQVKDKQVEVNIGGRPFTSYYFAGYAKPVFFPLRSASGRIVTRGYPIIPDVPGEPKDHPHQKGLWLTHGDVNGVDFWGEEPGHGTIVHRSFEVTKGGPQSGVLTSHNQWMAPSGKAVLDEFREVIIRGSAGERSLDFDIQLVALDDTVKFGDTKEGTFGIRLAQQFSDKAGGRMLNSRGAQGEKEVWGKPAEWVFYSTRIDGEAIGVAIFDHPSSFRHPTHWHARGYTLFAVNPFGLHDFYGDATKDGSHTLRKGESIRLRHRVYIVESDIDSAAMAEQYWAYSNLKLKE
ncbi:MAG: PmoA family protein [Acidobacteriota bacterium]